MRVEGGKKKPIRVARSGFVSTDHKKDRITYIRRYPYGEGLGGMERGNSGYDERIKWTLRTRSIDICTCCCESTNLPESISIFSPSFLPGLYRINPVRRRAL
jgi:hypothetical protein